MFTFSNTLVSLGGELDTDAPETGASAVMSPSLLPSLPRSSPAELRMASDSVHCIRLRIKVRPLRNTCDEILW